MNIKFFREHRGFWFLLLLFELCAFPKILLSIYRVTDPFFYSPISVSQESMKMGHILIHPFEPVGDTLQRHAHFISERAALTSLIIIISQIIGIPPRDLLFIPVNGIILMILSFVLARLFTNSNITAALFTIFIAFEPTINKLSHNLFYVGLGFSLFFVFLILFIRAFKSCNFSNNGILLLITFTTIYLTYYTTELYVIVFSFATIAVVLIISKSKSRRIKLVGGTNLNICSLLLLTAVFIMIFVSFDAVFYSYITQITMQDFFNSLISYLQYWRSLLYGEASATGMYASELHTAYIGLLLFLLISIPVMIYLFSLSLHFYRSLLTKRTAQIDFYNLVCFTLICPLVANIIVYGSIGFFDWKYFWLIFPLLAFFSISRFNEKYQGFNKRIRFANMSKIFLMCMILILCLVKFGAWLQDEKLEYAVSYDSIALSASRWLSEFASEGSALTDLRVGGRLLLDVVDSEKCNNIRVYLFTKESIRFLYIRDVAEVHEIYRLQDYNYLILPYRSIWTKIVGVNWQGWGPLGDDFWFFAQYVVFDKVYDDCQIVIIYNKL